MKPNVSPLLAPLVSLDMSEQEDRFPDPTALVTDDGLDELTSDDGADVLLTE
jgi:hypothetical protein